MAKQHDIQPRTFQFALRTIALGRKLLHRDAVLRRLAFQIISSGTSIGANLEEAAAAQTKPDFIAKCSIARKEAFEVRYWLRLTAAADTHVQGETAPLITEATELTRILTAMVKRARESPTRGGG